MTKPGTKSKQRKRQADKGIGNGSQVGFAPEDGDDATGASMDTESEEARRRFVTEFYPACISLLDSLFPDSAVQRRMKAHELLTHLVAGRSVSVQIASELRVTYVPAGGWRTQSIQGSSNAYGADPLEVLLGVLSADFLMGASYRVSGLFMNPL